MFSGLISYASDVIENSVRHVIAVQTLYIELSHSDSVSETIFAVCSHQHELMSLQRFSYDATLLLSRALP